MARGGNFTIDICITVDGKTKPYLTVHPDGRVEWLVSDEEQQEYEQKMLNNIGESMSDYYTAHPDIFMERIKE